MTGVQANRGLMQGHMQADSMTQTLYLREDNGGPLCYEVEVRQHSIGSLKVISGQQCHQGILDPLQHLHDMTLME